MDANESGNPNEVSEEVEGEVSSTSEPLSGVAGGEGEAEIASSDAPYVVVHSRETGDEDVEQLLEEELEGDEAAEEEDEQGSPSRGEADEQEVGGMELDEEVGEVGDGESGSMGLTVSEDQAGSSLSPDTSGVMLRYLSDGEGMVCVPLDSADGQVLAGMHLQEGDIVEQVELSSELEDLSEMGVDGIEEEREIISLEDNVLISTTIGEGDYAVLNWEGEEIIEMSTSETFDELEQQIQETVSSADGESGVPVNTALARQILMARSADSTTASAEANNNIIMVREDEVSTTEDENCTAASSSKPSASTSTVSSSQASSTTSTMTVASSNTATRRVSASAVGPNPVSGSPLASPPGPFSPQSSGISSSGSAGESRPGSSRMDVQGSGLATSSPQRTTDGVSSSRDNKRSSSSTEANTDSTPSSSRVGNTPSASAGPGRSSGVSSASESSGQRNVVIAPSGSPSRIGGVVSSRGSNPSSSISESSGSNSSSEAQPAPQKLSGVQPETAVTGRAPASAELGPSTIRALSSSVVSCSTTKGSFLERTTATVSPKSSVSTSDSTSVPIPRPVCAATSEASAATSPAKSDEGKLPIPAIGKGSQLCQQASSSSETKPGHSSGLSSKSPKETCVGASGSSSTSIASLSKTSISKMPISQATVAQGSMSTVRPPPTAGVLSSPTQRSPTLLASPPSSQISLRSPPKQAASSSGPGTPLRPVKPAMQGQKGDATPGNQYSSAKSEQSKAQQKSSSGGQHSATTNTPSSSTSGIQKQSSSPTKTLAAPTAQASGTSQNVGVASSGEERLSNPVQEKPRASEQKQGSKGDQKINISKQEVSGPSGNTSKREESSLPGSASQKLLQESSSTSRLVRLKEESSKVGGDADVPSSLGESLPKPSPVQKRDEGLIRASHTLIQKAPTATMSGEKREKRDVLTKKEKSEGTSVQKKAGVVQKYGAGESSVPKPPSAGLAEQKKITEKIAVVDQKPTEELPILHPSTPTVLKTSPVKVATEETLKLTLGGERAQKLTSTGIPPQKHDSPGLHAQKPSPSEKNAPVQKPTQKPSPSKIPSEKIAPVQKPTQKPSPSKIPSEKIAPVQKPTQTPSPSKIPSEKIAPVQKPTQTPSPSKIPSEKIEPVQKPTQKPSVSGTAAAGTPSQSVAGGSSVQKPADNLHIQKPSEGLSSKKPETTSSSHQKPAIPKESSVLKSPGDKISSGASLDQKQVAPAKPGEKQSASVHKILVGQSDQKSVISGSQSQKSLSAGPLQQKLSVVQKSTSLGDKPTLTEVKPTQKPAVTGSLLEKSSTSNIFKQKLDTAGGSLQKSTTAQKPATAVLSEQSKSASLVAPKVIIQKPTATTEKPLSKPSTSDKIKHQQATTSTVEQEKTPAKVEESSAAVGPVSVNRAVSSVYSDSAKIKTVDPKTTSFAFPQKLVPSESDISKCVPAKTGDTGQQNTVADVSVKEASSQNKTIQKPTVISPSEKKGSLYPKECAGSVDQKISAGKSNVPQGQIQVSLQESSVTTAPPLQAASSLPISSVQVKHKPSSPNSGEDSNKTKLLTIQTDNKALYVDSPKEVKKVDNIVVQKESNLAIKVKQEKTSSMPKEDLESSANTSATNKVDEKQVTSLQTIEKIERGKKESIEGHIASTSEIHSEQTLTMQKKSNKDSTVQEKLETSKNLSDLKEDISKKSESEKLKGPQKALQSASNDQPQVMKNQETQGILSAEETSLKGISHSPKSKIASEMLKNREMGGKQGGSKLPLSGSSVDPKTEEAVKAVESAPVTDVEKIDVSEGLIEKNSGVLIPKLGKSVSISKQEDAQYPNPNIEIGGETSSPTSQIEESSKKEPSTESSTSGLHQRQRGGMLGIVGRPPLGQRTIGSASTQEKKTDVSLQMVPAGTPLQTLTKSPLVSSSKPTNGTNSAALKAPPSVDNALKRGDPKQDPEQSKLMKTKTSVSTTPKKEDQKVSQPGGKSLSGSVKPTSVELGNKLLLEKPTDTQKSLDDQKEKSSADALEVVSSSQKISVEKKLAVGETSSNLKSIASSSKAESTEEKETSKKTHILKQTLGESNLEASSEASAAQSGLLKLVEGPRDQEVSSSSSGHRQTAVTSMSQGVKSPLSIKVEENPVSTPRLSPITIKLRKDSEGKGDEYINLSPKLEATGESEKLTLKLKRVGSPTVRDSESGDKGEKRPIKMRKDSNRPETIISSTISSAALSVASTSQESTLKTSDETEPKVGKLTLKLKDTDKGIVAKISKGSSGDSPKPDTEVESKMEKSMLKLKKDSGDISELSPTSTSLKCEESPKVEKLTLKLSVDSASSQEMTVDPEEPKLDKLMVKVKKDSTGMASPRKDSPLSSKTESLPLKVRKDSINQEKPEEVRKCDISETTERITLTLVKDSSNSVSVKEKEGVESKVKETKTEEKQDTSTKTRNTEREMSSVIEKKLPLTNKYEVESAVVVAKLKDETTSAEKLDVKVETEGTDLRSSETSVAKEKSETKAQEQRMEEEEVTATLEKRTDLKSENLQMQSVEEKPSHKLHKDSSEAHMGGFKSSLASHSDSETPINVIQKSPVPKSVQPTVVAKVSRTAHVSPDGEPKQEKITLKFKKDGTETTVTSGGSKEGSVAAVEESDLKLLRAEKGKETATKEKEEPANGKAEAFRKRKVEDDKQDSDVCIILKTSTTKEKSVEKAPAKVTESEKKTPGMESPNPSKLTLKLIKSADWSVKPQASGGEAAALEVLPVKSKSTEPHEASTKRLRTEAPSEGGSLSISSPPSRMQRHRDEASARPDVSMSLKRHDAGRLDSAGTISTKKMKVEEQLQDCTVVVQEVALPPSPKGTSREPRLRSPPPPPSISLTKVPPKSTAGPSSSVSAGRGKALDDGKLREILSKIGRKASALLDCDVSISFAGQAQGDKAGMRSPTTHLPSEDVEIIMVPGGVSGSSAAGGSGSTPSGMGGRGSRARGRGRGISHSQRGGHSQMYRAAGGASGVAGASQQLVVEPDILDMEPVITLDTGESGSSPSPSTSPARSPLVFGAPEPPMAVPTGSGRRKGRGRPRKILAAGDPLAHTHAQALASQLEVKVVPLNLSGQEGGESGGGGGRRGGSGRGSGRGSRAKRPCRGRERPFVQPKKPRGGGADASMPGIGRGSAAALAAPSLAAALARGFPPQQQSPGRSKKESSMQYMSRGDIESDGHVRTQGSDISVFAVPGPGVSSLPQLQSPPRKDITGSPTAEVQVIMEEPPVERKVPASAPVKRNVVARASAAATRKAKAQVASAAAAAARIARARASQEAMAKQVHQEMTIADDSNDDPRIVHDSSSRTPGRPGASSFFSPGATSSPLSVFGKGSSAPGHGVTRKEGEMAARGASKASPSKVPVVVLDEETRMSADISAMDTDSARDGMETDSRHGGIPQPSQPSAKNGEGLATGEASSGNVASSSGPGTASSIPGTAATAAGTAAAGEESQGSAVSSETISSTPGTGTPRRNKCRMEVCDPDAKEFTVDMLAEYQWPSGRSGEPLMLQEQVAEYLGVKSFKRKYPDVQRRAVEAEEKTYLREKGLVSDNLSDMGLTAISSVEVLDIMFTDFPEKYEEYRKHLRERQAKELTLKQKMTSNAERSRLDYRERAASSAASWNAKFNRVRREQRRACFDLQNLAVHFPASRIKKMTREVSKLGHYPVALIPGQYTDYYKTYTPAELRYFPLNTVLYGPMKPNERQESGGGSDGSQSESEDSSSSDESSSSSSSDGTQDSEETGSTAGDVEHAEGEANSGGTKKIEGSTSQTQSSQSSQSAPQVNGHSATAKEFLSIKDEAGICKICGGDRNRNKEGNMEVLIHCATCTSSCHPSCIDLTLDMVPHIKKYDWQCTDCKICIQCKDPADEDKMLFCDMCDRGFHIYCVGLRRVPPGRWHCRECAVCGSCGAREPGPGPDATWQHEYKKGDGKGSTTSSPSHAGSNTRVYAQTLCVSCSKLWRRGRYCQLCWRCFDAKTDDDASLVTCSVCDKMMHPDCCNAVGGIELDRANFLCEICQEKGHQGRHSSVKLNMRPVVKLTYIDGY